MRRIAEIAHGQNTLTLPPTASVQEACRHMHARKVGAVLVTDEEGQLLGIFTGRDAIGRVIAEGRDPAATSLGDVMTPKPRSMAPERPAIEALRLMFDIGCRHVPIVEHGKIVGVVSRTDFRGIELDRLDEETELWERL